MLNRQVEQVFGLEEFNEDYISFADFSILIFLGSNGLKLNKSNDSPSFTIHIFSASVNWI